MSFKCDFCPCVFCTKHDFNLHMQKFGAGKKEHFDSWQKLHQKIDCGLDYEGGNEKDVWRQSSYDDGKWCFAEDNPDLANILRRNGSTSMAGYEYSMSGKYIKRRLSKM